MPYSVVITSVNNTKKISTGHYYIDFSNQFTSIDDYSVILTTHSTSTGIPIVNLQDNCYNYITIKTI